MQQYSEIHKAFNDIERKPKKIGEMSKSNIMQQDEFRGKITSIFEYVAGAVSKTMGPFGQTTIIEQFGEMHVTKDGWSVLKEIRFDDNIDNNILMLLRKIATQLVNKVGDGTTSSIVAAQMILDQFTQSDIIGMDVSPRDFCNVLKKSVDAISEVIRSKSTIIDHETYNEEEQRLIYKLASISSNGNEEISEMVSKIYHETKNPAISFEQGKYAEHKLEIINGYKSKIRLLDGIYFNNDDGNRKTFNPMVLMFDHRIETIHYEKIIAYGMLQATQEGRELYVISPMYDSRMLEFIKRDVNGRVNAKAPLNTIYCRASIVDNLSRQMYQDLAILLGAQIITEVDAMEIFTPAPEGETKEPININEYLGTCNNVVIDMENGRFSGLDNKNETLYEASLIDAKRLYKESRDMYEGLDVYAAEVFDLKRRISALNCCMGVIYVGGTSTLEQKLNMDVLDDVVKSCENAYNYGFNLGCCLAIPRAISDVIDNDHNITQLELKILTMISTAFVDVYRTVIMNKYSLVKDRELVQVNVNEIICGSLESGQPYDLITNRYSNDIINPTNTDIEILKATTSIVNLLITSNQYLKVIID